MATPCGFESHHRHHPPKRLIPQHLRHQAFLLFSHEKHPFHPVFCSSLRSSLHNPLSNACADAWFNDNNIAHLRCRSIFRRCVQMCVDICGCVIAAVSKPLLYILHWYAIFQQQRSAGMPLRYNYDKPGKPRISRVFGYLARFFILFQTEKSSREVVIS